MLAAAVVDPSAGETWSAGAGAGATLTDARGVHPLHAGAGPDLGQALVATGFGYDAARRAEQAAVVARLLPQVRDLRRIGTASLDLCAVAAGRVDAYYELGLNPWDFAGGWLVAREAGALVTDFAGGAAGTHGLIAAGPGCTPSCARRSAWAEARTTRKSLTLHRRVRLFVGPAGSGRGQAGAHSAAACTSARWSVERTSTTVRPGWLAR